MRLDKYLAQLNIGTRSQVKELIRKKKVSVNQLIITNPDYSVDPQKDQVSCQGKSLTYSEFQYYVLNKPAGVVSATKDALSETVLSLLPKDHGKNLFPAGRLDKDTEGFLLITNDGTLAHDLLSPRKHVSKTYLANIRTPLSDNDVKKLEEGVDIGEDGLTAPAFLVRVYEPDKAGNWIHLTIHEGKFHQVKRMLEAVGNEVLSLKRIRFGALALDPRQKSGECRQLTDEEMQTLKNSQEIVARKKALLQGKKAVIFDLDGSLVDSMWLWGEIDDEYLARFGIQFYDHDELRRNIEGMSFHETAVYIKEYYNIPDSVEQMKDDWNQMAWDKYANEVPLKPGVLEFLEGCKRAHLKLGIATSNSRELVENVLHVHRLDNCFSCILTGNEITKGKPAPDIYLAVAKQLGVDPSECLVFEDIIPGLMAGKNAGMTICAVADLDSADSWQEKKALADDHIYDYYDFFDHT